jgi:hypothetical protein
VVAKQFGLVRSTTNYILSYSNTTVTGATTSCFGADCGAGTSMEIIIRSNNGTRVCNYSDVIATLSGASWTIPDANFGANCTPIFTAASNPTF